MWIEWTIGRFGGGFGHSTAPGMFHTLWNKNRFIKYFGVIGIFGPIVIFIYYTYVESWLLGYACFSAAGTLESCQGRDALAAFLSAYQGTGTSPDFPFAVVHNEYVSFSWIGYGFFLLTFAANLAVLYYGVRGGIEWRVQVGPAGPLRHRPGADRPRPDAGHARPGPRREQHRGGPGVHVEPAGGTPSGTPGSG